MCFFKAKTSFDFACFCCLLCLKSPVMVSLTPMPRWGKEETDQRRPCRGRRPDGPAAAVRFSKTFGEFAHCLPETRRYCGGVGDAATYKVNADSPDGLLRFCTAARNAEDGVPYRACANSPKVEANLCRVLRGPGHGLDSGPYRGSTRLPSPSPPKPTSSRSGPERFLLFRSAAARCFFHINLSLFGHALGVLRGRRRGRG